jgi:hypothetical protein
MWRPACRIIHTGVRSTFSPRAARINSGSCVFFPSAAAAVAVAGADEAKRVAGRAGGAAVKAEELAKVSERMVAAV